MRPGDHLPRPRQLPVPVVLLVMGCCVAVGAGPAFASHVSCGDTITADTTLDSDLVNCPNNGIVIGADDVMDGNDHGILLDSSNDNDVKGNRISHSGGSSIDLGHATGNRVEENVLRDNGDGVIVADGQGNLVSGNS